MTHLGLTRPMARQAPELGSQRIGILDPTTQGDTSADLLSRYPDLKLRTSDLQSATELMTRIELDELDMALVDERGYLSQRAFFPEQRFDTLTPRPRPIAPLFRHQPDESLLARVNAVLEDLDREGLMARLTDQYLGHTQEFDYVGVVTFERHLKSRLPRFRASFEAHAAETGMDWRLLAAVGYQESHWRANAVSPTGVRGLMMVTLRTAREMGINNRLDPAQSIAAGSRYLSELHGRIPERIAEPDRTWFALAAYNVGMGHLEDARILTERLGDDPDSWLDVRSHLPKLALKEWYPSTRFGYARGHEPVVYVANIRRYYTTLQRVFPVAEDTTTRNGGPDTLPLATPPPIAPF
jgi:membrane-bound lytic murein transglycosylase F